MSTPGALLIEGGGEVNASALQSGVVDRMIYFIAPKVLGGHDAIGAVGGICPPHLTDAVRLRNVMVSQVGSDIMIEGRVGKGTRLGASGAGRRDGGLGESGK